jgi:ATP-binding cassette, subfamily B, multidrug efflux pump
LIKLKKYLNPFMWALLLAILLLFAQAICELNLPNYMSRIVNVGIQQSGVEHATPDQISVEGYSLMNVLMDEEGQALMTANYSRGEEAVNDKEVYI